MLNQQFNSFLVKHLVEWFGKELQIGYRYRLYSDDTDKLQDILRALQNIKTGTINYLNTSLAFISIKSTKLIFVNDIEESMNEHFISNLRDAISTPEDCFIGCSLLVIHKSRLDTLLNSAHNLSSKQSPFHPETVKIHLEALCRESTKAKLFEALLDIQTKQMEMDNQSAFGYEGIYNSIINDVVDFKGLNLFEDTDLENFDSTKKIKKRIEENQKLYTDIEYNIINFSNELTDKLTKFSPEFIDRYITVDNWEDVKLKQLKNEIEDNAGERISYDTSFEITEDKYLIRDDSTTPAGTRSKNIIVFAEDNNVSLLLKFIGDGLSVTNFSLLDNEDLDDSVFSYMHRKLDIQIPFNRKPCYFRIRLQTAKSSETHMFKFLILQKDSFYLDGIKNHFLIKPKQQSLLLKLDTFELDFTDNVHKRYSLPENENVVNILEHTALNTVNFYNAHDEVMLSITNGDDSIDLLLENEKIEDKISLPLLFNTKRIDRLLSDGINAEYNYTKKKAILDNREFLLVGDRNTYIEYEHHFILNQAYKIENIDYKSCDILDDIDVPIANTYKALLNYFLIKKTTPSLCAWDDEVTLLASVFIDSYLVYLSKLESNSIFTNEQKIIFELGFVEDKNKKFMSPFSPLVLSYVIYLRNSIDDSYQHIFDVTLKRLNVKGLLPYFFIDNDTYAYSKVVDEDPLWIEFVPNEENEFSYISKLTTEKINEFKESFSALFTFGNKSSLIINSVNNGMNQEVFEGIVNFYKKSFNEPTKIIINLYDDKFEETAFDIFSDTDSYENLKSMYKIKDDDAETIIDVMRTHITYSKHLTTEDQNYCHLSLFKNNEKVEIRNQNVLAKKSGLVHKGLISGESAENKDGFYYSGFGLKGVDIENNSHLKLAKIYNAMQRPIYESGSEYIKDNTISLMISDNFKSLLEKSYSSALWTVIIDPKVTLDFFDGYKDLILIHYSDQYSSSANYDAITVTAKTNLYSSIVGSISTISEFNAFNGEWLIKMITEAETIKKEKYGIIAAYKYITALLYTDKITWVPLSVAEMIRVSGNVGLSMGKSDFSRYNESKEDEELKLGPISDDILMVGLCKDDIILYPVEVKSGSASLTKATKQAKALKSYFYNHLFEGDTLKSRLLKGLFIRQLFMQVEKYELYNVFDENYFDNLHEKREILLDGDYSLVELDNNNEGSVVAFLDVCLDTSISLKDSILECQIPYDFLSNMLNDSFDNLKTKIQNGEYGTHKPSILQNIRCKNTIVDEITSQETKIIEVDTEIEKEIVQNPVMEKVISSEPMQIKFGRNILNKNDILWYPTDTSKTLNTNTGIIGTMGTGKTQFTKSLITQLHQNQSSNVTESDIGILIFDYKGDYIDDEFINATNAKVYELEKLPFNPLALFGNKPKQPIHTGRTLTTTLAKAFNLGTVQQATLKQLIGEAYTSKGISSNDKTTWSLEAPTLNDIWEVFINQEKVNTDSLYAALDDLIDFEIFEPDASLTKSLYDVVDGVTVINLSGYDSNIQNLIVAIALDQFYIQMHNQGSSTIEGDFRQISKMVLVDEADNFMSQDFASIKKILKEGREFGVGTILSTQQLTHFKTSEDNYAEYINTWVVHKVSSIKSQDVTSLFNISNKQEAESLMEQIRKLEKHFSIYVDGNKNMIKMRDLAFWELMMKN
ncbi:MAG: DNA phosphorothioation-dependent restriction protein DptH [Sulfurovum sp.]|nr:DNA phosphorothioation-dependent restriction protein DptH [Sulfurovum sp.]